MENNLYNALIDSIKNIGKPEWRKTLEYVCMLHAKSVHPPIAPFCYPWEEIGPGYISSPAFGHWDIVHELLDSVDACPAHTANQLKNLLQFQESDGFMPGVIFMKSGSPVVGTRCTHPPVWPVVAEKYLHKTGDREFKDLIYKCLIKLITWFEQNRSAGSAGYYYLDITANIWDSGVDQGARFDCVPKSIMPCIDATSHVYMLYQYAAKWTEDNNLEREFLNKGEKIKSFITKDFFDEETGFFHDLWAVNNPEKRVLSFEGIWPLVVGAADYRQAQRVINENLLNQKRFFTKHPISTVSVSDHKFELRLWRGPAWNSMSYWAAVGCVKYNRSDAAKMILENAMDATSKCFKKTGTIWEFYHSHGGNPMEVQRKPSTGYNMPCSDYLGHNPLIAMVKLWDEIK
ncbi:MAG: trehalase family glycosidase [Victivallaceae bacterium]